VSVLAERTAERLRHCVGINTDAAAVTNPALLRACLVDGFAEMLALASEAGS
jgi:hypothetical protein